MAIHKKKARRAAQRRIAAIDTALNKLRPLMQELQQMMRSQLKTGRLPDTGTLIEVPVTEEDRATWRAQLATLEEKMRLLTTEREGIEAGTILPPPECEAPR